VGGSTTAGSSIGNSSNTWSYNSSGWFKQSLNEYIIPPNGGQYSIPSLLTGASMCYLSGDSECVLVGGTADYENSKYSLDCWTWATGNPGSWTQLSPPNGYVGVKYPAWASNGTLCVMFGGKNYQGASSNVYHFNSTSFTQITGFTPGYTCPTARYGANLVWDASQSLFYLFGGIQLDGRYVNDLWSYNSGTQIWTNITPTYSPSPRAFSAMCYNPNTGNSVLFSGLADRNSWLPDTWLLTAGVWSNVGP
jgi:hypothetical protein